MNIEICLEKLEGKQGRQTNGQANISHETTTMVVWIYDGI